MGIWQARVQLHGPHEGQREGCVPGQHGDAGGTLPLQGLAEDSLEVVTSSGPVTALCHRWQSVSKTKNRQKEMSWIWGENRLA